MSGILTGNRSNDLALQGAILLYGPGQGEFTYATAHCIDTEAASGKAVIGPGVPLNRRALVHAVKGLAEAALPKGEFLTANILAVTPNAVTWWCPPAQRRIFFKSKELGERSAKVWHPALVFQASFDGFRVFSLMEDVRPMPGSPLFEPPYFNTWDHGAICIGSARVPKLINVASVLEWEEAFFLSAFTHPNNGGPRVQFERGAYAFWKDMLDGAFPAFPKEVLIPMKYTVGDLIAGKKGA
ncbi:hypothetical protein GO285_01399 [Ralstonia solanacearum]|nr:hypothetical protein [Ralstonia solanacearum]NKG09592.1 hypothetical protein [Ralstonia solanacearum]